MENISLEDIKRYNNKLREYKQMASELKARIDFSRSELEKQCREISNELGYEVTPDNIEEVYREVVKKVQNTLKHGQEILERINQEKVYDSKVKEYGAEKPPVLEDQILDEDDDSVLPFEL